LNGQKEPFFVNYFTLSSHEPFEVPMETVFKGDDMKDKFINAHHYTDRSLGKFIAEAKNKTGGKIPSSLLWQIMDIHYLMTIKK
jgi:phosphoglycerol transferase MdoB-like AlkP superfamily enzyme